MKHLVKHLETAGFFSAARAVIDRLAAAFRALRVVAASSSRLGLAQRLPKFLYAFPAHECECRHAGRCQKNGRPASPRPLAAVVSAIRVVVAARGGSRPRACELATKEITAVEARNAHLGERALQTCVASPQFETGAGATLPIADATRTPGHRKVYEPRVIPLLRE